jgi:hypothetical protein
VASAEILVPSLRAPTVLRAKLVASPRPMVRAGSWYWLRIERSWEVRLSLSLCLYRSVLHVSGARHILLHAKAQPKNDCHAEDEEEGDFNEFPEGSVGHTIEALLAYLLGHAWHGRDWNVFEKVVA